MQNDKESILDLSQARYVKPEEKKLTAEDVRKCLPAFKATLKEAINTRFQLLQEMSKALDSRLAVAPGQTHPGVDLQQRIRFMDNSIRRMTDVVNASWIIIHSDGEDEGSTLYAPFPAMAARVQDVINIIVNDSNKSITEVKPEDAILVSGFADLKSYLRPLNVCDALE